MKFNSTTELLYAIQRWKQQHPQGPGESATDYEARVVEAFYDMGYRHGQDDML